MSVEAMDVQVINFEVINTSNDDLIQKISNVRTELSSLGYSNEMMNNLFGDENFYFPTNPEKLDIVIHIVDKLIDNGQYKNQEKPVLIKLAEDAYTMMQEMHSKE